MKKIILTTFLSLLLFPLMAVETNQAVKTSAPEGRFEIVQSEIIRKNTFKIDKCTGRVWVLCSSNSGPWWSEMYREGYSQEDYKTGTNFQIFMGGMMARDCFVMDVNTGKTWVLVESDSGTLRWSKMD